jgi:sulfur carrier protein ThiS
VKVAISAFGDVQRQVKDRHDLDLADGSTVADLIQALGLQAGPTLTVGVNGQMVPLDSTLNDGDKVMLVTPMEGGCVHA